LLHTSAKRHETLSLGTEVNILPRQSSLVDATAVW
jgi:hypothetical protein